MPDRTQLPHLLRLVDDRSENVRQAVGLALASFGDELKDELEALEPPAGDEAIQLAVAAAMAALTPTETAGQAEPSEADATKTPEPFEVGQLVLHRRYGYRGIVVAVDDACRADDSWYQSNRSRPKREQPWYHVLVHDSEQVTYAAQTSLDVDASGDAVEHPLLPHFFDEVGEGLYLRNSREWPGWEAGSA